MKAIQILIDGDVRKEVIVFAVEMERTLRKHDKEKGDSWKRINTEFLITKLQEEEEEFDRKYWQTAEEDDNELVPEVIDIANVCMMLFHRLKKCPLKEGCK